MFKSGEREFWVFRVADGKVSFIFCTDNVGRLLVKALPRLG